MQPKSVQSPITLRRAYDAVLRAALNLDGLVENLESHLKRKHGPDVPMRRAHAAELHAVAHLIFRLGQRPNEVAALLHEDTKDVSQAAPPGNLAGV